MEAHRDRSRVSVGRRVLGLTVVLGIWFAAQSAQGQQMAPTISVTVNKSLVLRLTEKASRVSVTQPEVADVLVVAPTQLLINGKGVGSTSMVVWPESGEIINYDLVVVPDVASLRAQLKAFFPEEKVNVATSGPNIVLTGEVSNEVVYDKVLELTISYLPPKPPGVVAPPTAAQAVNISTQKTTFPTTGSGFAGGGTLSFEEEAALTDANRWGDKRRIPEIIDLLTIREVRQVQVDVIVAEVSLSKLRELGLDFSVITKDISFRSNLGSQGGFPTELLGDQTGRSFTFGDATSAIFQRVAGRTQILSLFRLFQNKDLTEILAQPRLVMKNGRSGGFLAGGEFPVPTVLAESSTLEFKPFGVRLDFVPTITWSNTIDLRVLPEVSEVDFSVAVGSIPGLKVRRTANRVELREGESLVIGGLLDRRILKDVTKFPLLGDIPILGALFRSTRFRNQESELIFVITPRIVTAMKPGEKPKLPGVEKFDDPDIRQFPIPAPQKPETSRMKPATPGATIP